MFVELIIYSKFAENWMFLNERVGRTVICNMAEAQGNWLFEYGIKGCWGKLKCRYWMWVAKASAWLTDAFLCMATAAVTVWGWIYCELTSTLQNNGNSNPSLLSIELNWNVSSKIAHLMNIFITTPHYIVFVPWIYFFYSGINVY